MISQRKKVTQSHSQHYHCSITTNSTFYWKAIITKRLFMQADACLLLILDREHHCSIKDAQDSEQGRGIGKHETPAPNVSQSCANRPDSRAAPTARKQTDVECDSSNEYELNICKISNFICEIHSDISSVVA